MDFEIAWIKYISWIYNESKLSFTQKELIDLELGIAKGELKQKNMYEWIKFHLTY
mgnify:CR=1 FL=1